MVYIAFVGVPGQIVYMSVDDSTSESVQTSFPGKYVGLRFNSDNGEEGPTEALDSSVEVYNILTGINLFVAECGNARPVGGASPTTTNDMLSELNAMLATALAGNQDLGLGDGSEPDSVNGRLLSIEGKIDTFLEALDGGSRQLRVNVIA